MNISQQQINNSAEQDNSDTNQFLTFILAGEEYGVDILCVQEIRGWTQATEIPRTPDYVLGVLNLRGTIVSIVDLRRLFDLSKIDYGPTTVIVIVKVSFEGTERTVGLVVDAISDVYNISEESIHPAPDVGGVVDIEFIKGLSTVQDKMVILLEIDRLINVGVLKQSIEASVNVAAVATEIE